MKDFEYFALKSAENSLKTKRIKNILIELHPAQLKILGYSSEEVIVYLQKNDYKQDSLNSELFIG